MVFLAMPVIRTAAQIFEQTAQDRTCSSWDVVVEFTNQPSELTITDEVYSRLCIAKPILFMYSRIIGDFIHAKWSWLL
jgi:hypothetical protein